MQTAARNREPDPRSFAARKGHLPQLSISDDSRHVTEAIGYMYGDDGASPTSPHNNRSSYRSDPSTSRDLEASTRLEPNTEKPLPIRKTSYGDRTNLSNTLNSSSPMQNYGWEPMNGTGPGSPLSARERSPSDTANTQFPLTNIDYESSPAAVQQELNNLQALRRMSMDVAATGDPDLPHLNTAAIPNAPSSASSEDDSARLFWVPARLHPELAPTEFKSFLESKAEQIKRRSGELSAFSSPASSRSNSLSASEPPDGLKRKKSMLSRQINNSVGYQDGADRLERKKSRDQKGSPLDNLEELESLYTLDSSTQRTSLDSRPDEENGDVILPSKPSSSLKRSTRTKYQKSEGRKPREDRATYAQRAARRAAAGGSESPSTPSDADLSAMGSFSMDFNLASTLKDPNTPPPKPVSNINFSRPAERSSSPPAPIPSPTFDSILGSSETGNRSSSQGAPDSRQRRAPTLPSNNQQSERPIPQIIESPPPEDRPVRTSSMRPPNAYPNAPSSSASPEPSQQTSSKSSHQRPGMPSKQSSTTLANPNRMTNRSPELPAQTIPSQTLEQPSALPSNDTNTSNLSYIPTLNIDKRQEVKKREEKKSGWSRLLGEKERDKEREKDFDKPKQKISKPPQSHDNTRLDVLQTSIDGGAKGRESLVLDRESIKIDDDRKKDGGRKVSSSSDKKEKEGGGFFSSLFGGKKHKAEKEAQKKMQERLSPEPRSREMRPDVDYNWTRFSILEERAIYRMAHIKLANPRRALYSQVLLSNFMYSYLAKVQQMHPQMNLPTSAKQQRKQKEQERLQQQQQQQAQPDEYTQYQRYQQQQASQQQQQPQSQSQQQYSQQQGYDHDNSASYEHEYSNHGNYGNTPQSSQWGPGSRSGNNDRSGQGSGNSYSIVGGGNAYYHQQHPQQHSRQNNQYNGGGDDDHDNDEMW